MRAHFREALVSAQHNTGLAGQNLRAPGLRFPEAVDWVNGKITLERDASEFKRWLTRQGCTFKAARSGKEGAALLSSRMGDRLSSRMGERLFAASPFSRSRAGCDARDLEEARIDAGETKMAACYARFEADPRSDRFFTIAFPDIPWGVSRAKMNRTAVPWRSTCFAPCSPNPCGEGKTSLAPEGIAARGTG